MAALVEILLPITDRKLAGPIILAAQKQLAARFGGATLFMRSPAEGLWSGNEESLVRDDIVVLEVMCAHLDPSWWKDFRSDLERKLKQDEIVVRAFELQRL